MIRLPQPPIDPAARAPEHHGWQPGLTLAAAGLAVALWGAWHFTGVGTVDGIAARESELVQAFSSGGVQYASEQAAPPPPNLADVANPAEALDRWAKSQANVRPPAWKIRIDVGIKTPCPT